MIMWGMCVWVCVCVGVTVGAQGGAQFEAPMKGMEETEAMPRCVDTSRCSYVGGRRTNNEREYKINNDINTKILIQYTDSTSLQVTCKYWAALECDALPQFATLRVPHVKFAKCPPPAGGSFAATLRALNVTLLRRANLTLAYLPPLPPLQASHFAGLEDLVALQLFTRHGSAPLPGFLRGLRNLRLLRVHEVKLPRGELDYLPDSLNVLSLRYAGVERLPEKVLALPNLWTLELEEKSLSTFAIPRQLRRLSFATQNNMLVVSHIPILETLTLVKWLEKRPVAFAQCGALRALKLVSPAVDTLPQDWLVRCSTLEHLELENASKLSFLPPKLFENASALTHFRLTYSKLETLPDELFANVTNLIRLELRHNRLKTLNSGAFEGLSALMALDLSENMLVAAAMEALAGLHSLSSLNLAYNRRLGDLCPHSMGNSPFLKMKNISSLILKKTNITRICRDWRENMTLLETLDLQKTKISVLQFSDLYYTRTENNVVDAVVRLEFTPVVSLRFSEEDFNASLAAARSGALVQLDGAARLRCDCEMYWARRALQPAGEELAAVGKSAPSARVVGLQCASGTALADMSPDDLQCSVPPGQWLPPRCTLTARPAPLARQLLTVRCDAAGLTTLPLLPPTKDTRYDLLLPNNNISTLTLQDLPLDFRVLDLRNNSLQRVDEQTVQIVVERGWKFLLGGNPLACDCRLAPLLQALHAAVDASDLHSASCADGSPLHEAAAHRCARVPLAAWLAAALAASLTVTSFMVAYFTPPARRILFKFLLIRWGVWRPPPELDDDRPFHAFVSFCHEDEAAVLQLVERLERGPDTYRVCVQGRDWTPGRLVSEQIAECAVASLRTLAVLSRAALACPWARAARRAALSDVTRPRLVVVLLDDVSALPLDDELHAYLTTNTYLRWGDDLFWDKLKLALPKPRPRPTSAVPLASDPEMYSTTEPLLCEDRTKISIALA